MADGPDRFRPVNDGLIIEKEVRIDMTTKEQSFLQQYRKNSYATIFDCYRHPSDAKLAAWHRLCEDARDKHHHGYRVCGVTAQCFSFGAVEYRPKDGYFLHYTTRAREYVILVGVFVNGDGTRDEHGMPMWVLNQLTGEIMARQEFLHWLLYA